MEVLILLHLINQTTNIMATEKVTIESELKRRMDLVNDRSFRIKCSILARQTGISVEEWNNNKAIILMAMANEYCRLENNINKL